MNQFFYINSAGNDGTGMVVLRETLSGAPSLRTSWGRKSDDRGRFPSRVIPWQQEEAEVMQRTVGLTVVQKSLPTDFIAAWDEAYRSSFYVSRRVVEALDKSGLKGWTVAGGLFRVVNRNGEFLRNEIFFDIIPLGEAPDSDVENWEKIHADDRSAGYRKSDDQTEEALKKAERGHMFRRFLPRKETWGGQHFMFEPKAVTFTGQLLCSREVVELAHREQWTNAAFQPLDMLDRDYTDFRLRCWPPEKWYPRWHPAYEPALHEQEYPDPAAANRKKLEEMREKYPAWISIEDFPAFEEELAYVKRHAANLSKAPMEHSADVAYRLWNFTQIRQMLDAVPEGPADDGLLLAVLLEANNSKDINARWCQSLSPGRRARLQHLLMEPPDELIDVLTHAMSISLADIRRGIAGRLGLSLVIPNRERFDGE